MTTSSTTSLSSVSRGLQLLRLFSIDQPELTFSQIVERSQLPKSTVHRLLQSLLEDDFLSFHPTRKVYTLGLSVLHLGGIIHVEYEPHYDAIPLLQEMCGALHCEIHVYVLENKQCFRLFSVLEHTATVNHSSQHTVELCSHEALILLAFQKETIQRELYDRDIFQTVDQWLNLLRWIRRRQYFTYFDDNDKMFYISLPIFDYTGYVSSFISIQFESLRSFQKIRAHLATLPHYQHMLNAHFGHFNEAF